MAKLVIFFLTANFFLMFFFDYFSPVLLKPPSPLSVSSSFTTSFHSIFSTLFRTACAILSPGFMTNGVSERFTRQTFTSPL